MGAEEATVTAQLHVAALFMLQQPNVGALPCVLYFSARVAQQIAAVA